MTKPAFTPKVLTGLILGIGACIPAFAMLPLGAFVGWLLRMLRFRRRIITANLELAFGSDRSRWPDGLWRRVHRHFGLLLVELLRLPHLSQQHLHATVRRHGLEHLAAARAHDKGVISVTGHFGNWEHCLVGGGEPDLEMSVVVKDLKGVDNERLFHELRGKRGVRSLRKDGQVLGHVLRLLRKRQMAVFVIDQRAKRSEALTSTFLGRPCRTFKAPFLLAARTGAPLLPTYCWRDADGLTHHVTYLAPVFPASEADADLAAAADLVHAALEKALREHDPAGWIWMHARFHRSGTIPAQTAAQAVIDCNGTAQKI